MKLADLTKKNVTPEMVEKEVITKPTTFPTKSSEAHTLCTICAEPMANYFPKYFLGI